MVFAAVVVAGCSEKPASVAVSPADAAAPARASGTGGAALPVAPGAHAATSGALGVPSEAYVTQPTFVRRLASEAKEVSLPGHKKRQANWLATLNRGEHVRVLEEREGWLQVQSSDEARGWIKEEGVLVGPEITQATNLGPLHRFTRPDLLALVASRPVEPGSLLFVLRQKEAFSEVNYSGNATAWVLTDALEREPDEVAAAKLLHRARQLADRDAAAAQALLELARSRYPQSRIVAAASPGAEPLRQELVPAGSQAPLGSNAPEPGSLPEGSQPSPASDPAP